MQLLVELSVMVVVPSRVINNSSIYEVVGILYGAVNAEIRVTTFAKLEYVRILAERGD